MASVIIILFLLLLAESIVFSAVLHDDGFMNTECENSACLMYSLALGGITFASFYITGSLFDVEEGVLTFVVAALLSGLVVLYQKLYKKNAKWLYSLPLAVNCLFCVYAAQSFPFGEVVLLPLTQYAANAVAVTLTSLCFCSLKNYFMQKKQGRYGSYVMLSLILILSICFFLGFDL